MNSKTTFEQICLCNELSLSIVFLTILFITNENQCELNQLNDFNFSINCN